MNIDARSTEVSPIRTVVGLCGLGNMGMAVAQRLATSYDVVAYDPNEERQALAEQLNNVRAVDDLGHLAAAGMVVLSLPAPAISQSTCQSLAEILQPEAVVVETSTTTPADVQGCAAVLEKAGVRIIDAAILSGVGQMENGQATLLVGGDDATLQLADPLLHVLGLQVQAFGSLGSGMAAKVVNNAVAHSVMVVLVEAMSMSAASGVDLEKIAAMLQAPDGGLIRPLTHRVMERIASGSFDGGMPLDAARKDSTLALNLAQQHGVPLFAIQATHSVYEIAASHGLGRKDYAALATLWEQWTGNSLAYLPQQGA
jgi:3-hydroxyisobutyrate dehydrogenase-like beta-hydroxyacid dehydrogenase